MTNYVIEPAPQVSLPIRGSDARFPVRRIYCIGRNYADHAIEMGHDPDKEPPFFFQKNGDNVDTSGEFPYPPQTSDVHFEMEMIVALKSGGANISEADALNHVYGYGLGLDMTRRDLQGEAKKMGRPWEIGKAFERSAPMSELVQASETGHLDNGRISLTVNGEIRQDGDLNQMIWKVPEMISYLSRFYDIAAGDLIMSGTPAGVGAIQRGDVLVGTVENLGSFTVTVV
jgi:fumarylpyruvate hydrolase